MLLYSLVFMVSLYPSSYSLIPLQTHVYVCSLVLTSNMHIKQKQRKKGQFFFRGLVLGESKKSSFEFAFVRSLKPGFHIS